MNYVEKQRMILKHQFIDIKPKHARVLKAIMNDKLYNWSQTMMTYQAFNYGVIVGKRTERRKRRGKNNENL